MWTLSASHRFLLLPLDNDHMYAPIILLLYIPKNGKVYSLGEQQNKLTLKENMVKINCLCPLNRSAFGTHPMDHLDLLQMCLINTCTLLRAWYGLVCNSHIWDYFVNIWNTYSVSFFFFGFVGVENYICTWSYKCKE